VKIGVDKREFEFHLTDEERHYRAAQASSLCEEALRLKGEAQKLTQAVSQKTKEMQQLLAVHRTGLEARSVECEVIFIDGLQEVQVIRVDTGELIDRRRPTEEDWRNIQDARQTQLSFVKPRSKARKDDEAKPS
jgi:hypothetical protein